MECKRLKTRNLIHNSGTILEGEMYWRPATEILEGE